MRFKLKTKILFVIISTLFLVNTSKAQENPTPVPKTKQISKKPASKKSTSSKKKTKNSMQKNKASSKKNFRQKASSKKTESNEKKSKKDEESLSKTDAKTESAEEKTDSKNLETTLENKPMPSEKQNLPLPIMKEGDRLPFMQKKNLETPTQETNSTSVLTKTFGALLVVLGVLFFGVWGLKRTGIIKSSQSNIENSPELAILSSVSPQNGQTISIVQFGKQTLLVGSTANSFTLLASAGEILTNNNENLEKLVEKTNENFDFENKPRSVSELLAEEEDEGFIFKEELKKAQDRISTFRNYGGNH